MTMTNDKMWASLISTLSVGAARLLIDHTAFVATDFAVLAEAIRVVLEAAFVAAMTWAVPNREKAGD